MSSSNNKSILVLVVILLGICFSSNTYDLAIKTIGLFDNEAFKLVIFFIITLISSSNPVIGISLAILLFATLQIITYIKLKNELDIRNY